MSEAEDRDTEGGAELWARYRAASPAAAAAPDALELAAYAENRLGEEASARLESWLARHPDSIDDILAARAVAMSAALPLGRPAEIEAARALIAPPRGGGAMPQIVRGIGWGSVAAGLLIACLIGYEAGVATGGHTSVALTSVAREMGFGAGGNLGLLAMGGGDAGEEL